MQAASMPSKAQNMQSLFAQLSGLMGLVVFLNQAWHYVPLERTILTAFGAGIAAYLVLVLGYASAQRILAYTPPETEGEESAEADEQATDDASTEASASDDDAREAAGSSKRSGDAARRPAERPAQETQAPALSTTAAPQAA